MNKVYGALLAGVAAAALAGTAIAANSKIHVMSVPLPDGSVARVEYVGDVAPKVTVDPSPLAGDFWIDGLPSFASFDRMFERMDRQMRTIEQMARQPADVPGMNIASYGNKAAGANSVSVVSFSNGGSTCTRTTKVTSQGPGKPPKVVSNVSGNCGPAAAPAPPTSPITPT